MTVTLTATRPVGVDELRRAWHAVQEGAFRQFPQQGHTRRLTSAREDRQLSEPVLPVIGCLPQSGASTLALALATVTRGRVVECCSSSASGLVGAATAELGTGPGGWAIGRRDETQIARTRAVHLTPADVPAPIDGEAAGAATVLDLGWDLHHVLASDGWLRDELTGAPRVVLVSTATVPGLRRLENALALLGDSRPIVAVRTRAGRRWPRELRGAVGVATQRVRRAGNWVDLPHDRHLELRGVDSARLPPALLAAAAAITDRAGLVAGPMKGTS